MRVFGLIGKSLGHSFSKQYFTKKFQDEDLSGCVYKNFPIADLRQAIPTLKTLPDLAGLNVTIPYKSDIIPFLDETNPVCEQIGACNCILIREGKWKGYNTDIIGFARSFLPGVNQRKSAIILGTGGAAAAIAFVLSCNEIPYLFVSRNPEGKKNTIGYTALDAAVMEQYQIIINTTPTGTFPNVKEYPAIPYQYISANHYLYDLIYNPVETAFLKMGAVQGALIKNGEEMLRIQAEESWRIWNEGCFA